jgi:hypothetical protein
VLRGAFGAKRDEMMGNEESYIMRSCMIFVSYKSCAGGKIKKNEMGRVLWLACGRREVCKGKEPLGKPKRRWEHKIKIDSQHAGLWCGEWMELAQVRDRWRDF